MNAPVSHAAHLRADSAVPRYDGKEKVSGAAVFSSDHRFANTAHAYFVCSPVAKARITSLNTAVAKAMPGVLDILTYQNLRGEIRPSKHIYQGGVVSDSVPPLMSPEVAYAGQIVAVVLAESFEVARDAARRVSVTYEQQPLASTFDSPGVVHQPLASQRQNHEDPQVGDFDGAFARAPVKVDASYSTPTQHHNPMELFTVTCVWNGEELTLYEPSQSNYGKKFALAQVLAIDPQRIRVLCHYTGGGFGSKGVLTYRTALVAVAARRLGRPVKLVPPRDQGFTLATYRAETRHRLRLGASPDGRLTALSHEGWELTSRADPYAVAGTESTTRMYACRNVASKVTLVRADRSTPGFMRAPPEMPYFFALESAMDELATALGMDPVELRRVNDTRVEPIKGLRYTSRSMMQCFDEAAEAFGWKQRDPRPGSMRRGDWLVGWGCAASTYPVCAAPAAARVRLAADGRASVETSGHEIGQGMYTIAAQTAAETLGIPIGAVTVRMGDTHLPPAPLAAGSLSAASVCSAILGACQAIRRRVGVRDEGRADVVAALRNSGAGAVEELFEYVPNGSPAGTAQGLYQGRAWPVVGSRRPDNIQMSFGAQFVEVHVHALTREVRVPRVVAAFAAGRILNARTAHSQYMGGVIWGIGSALHEETQIDRRHGRYVNTNFADYLIPVNADIGEVQVIMVGEEDREVNPLGAKGIGEIGTVGTAAALANAVFHATGKRIRDLPIRLEDLLEPPRA